MQNARRLRIVGLAVVLLTSPTFLMSWCPEYSVNEAKFVARRGL